MALNLIACSPSRAIACLSLLLDCKILHLIMRRQPCSKFNARDENDMN